MKTPQGGKRFVALSAAVALGLGGAMVTAPASATSGSDDLAKVAAEAFSSTDQIAAIGHGANGEIVVQVVSDSVGEDGKVSDSAVEQALEPVHALAQDVTGEEPVVQPVASKYSTPTQSVEAQAGANPDYKASDDVVAGAGYVSNLEGGGFLCSVGFPATDADGNDAIITAGHCGDDGHDVYVERPSTANAFTEDYGTAEWDQSRKLGTFTHSQFGPTLHTDIIEDDGTVDPSNLSPENMQDFAVITVDKSAGFNLIGEAATWSEESGGKDDLAADTTDITGVHDVTTDDVNKEVFHSGRTTGKTKGNIGWDNESHGAVSYVGIVDGYAPIADDNEVEHMVYGFASTTPVGGGDSGGTVMMGDKAVGVVSGGMDANPEEGTPVMLWTAELQEGLNHLPDGMEIKTTESDDDTTTPPTEDPTEKPTEEPTDDPTTEAPDVDAALAVDPQEIAAEQFIAEDETQAIEEDRGVTYTVTDVEPGSEVVFDTYTGAAESANAGTEAAPEADTADKPAKSITVTADEDGTASSRVWGLPTADASAYVGDYDVVVTTEDETLEGSFSVVAGDDNGDGGQDDGDDLPRTGSTTGPLVAGAAGLVALGGALVYVARRRKA